MSMAIDSHSSWMNSGHRYSEPGPQRLPPRNEVDLSRDMLIAVLTQLSILIQTEFNGTPLRLVVHGGACILLHPDLHKLQTVSHNGDRIQRRTKTRDVDYIHRSFVAEYASRFPDAGERLQRCIRTTAANFRLGADWMNSDPDPALPMVPDATGKPYDPIYHASIQPNNIHMHTIFTSPNKILTLISVTPFWAVALKLVRYTPNDASDIILILRNGTSTNGVQWTAQTVQAWLLKYCWPMGYNSYPAEKIKEMQERINHAVSNLGNSAASSTSSVNYMGANGPHNFVGSPPPGQIQRGWGVSTVDVARGSSPWPHSPQAWAGPGPSAFDPPVIPQISRGAFDRHTIKGSYDQGKINSFSPVEFDRDLAVLLNSRSYHHPNQARPPDAEYYDAKARSRAHTTVVKEKHRDKAKHSQARVKEKAQHTTSKLLGKLKSKRTKWMPGWGEPDDSDSDEFSGSDDEGFSSSDEEADRRNGSGSDSWTVIPSHQSSPYHEPKEYQDLVTRPPPPLSIPGERHFIPTMDASRSLLEPPVRHNSHDQYSQHRQLRQQAF